MQGHEPFLDLNSLDDNDESEIIAPYTSDRFPPLSSHLGGNIVHICWSGRYESAIEVLEDLKRIMEMTLRGKVMMCVLKPGGLNDV